MIVYPNCKINIGLKVLNKRKDGFHNLESVFLPVAWHDALEIIENKTKKAPKVTLSTSGLTIAGSETSNLCVKAYQLINKDYELPPIKLHLHKTIPMGAGLGGGSSDGTFTLKLLNQIFDLKLTSTQLSKYAVQLGSDCPFFLKNTPCFASGRGEKLKKIALKLTGTHIVIVYPNIHINTTAAFNNIIRTDYTFQLSNLSDLNMHDWRNNINNDFEGYAFEQFPKLQKIKEQFYQNGAIYASMSGSGSAIFGLFDSKIKIPKGWNQYAIFQVIL